MDVCLVIVVVNTDIPRILRPLVSTRDLTGPDRYSVLCANRCHMPDSDDPYDLPRESVVPHPETRARMKCADCGERFRRNKVRTAGKGTLVCPECGSPDVHDV